MYRYFLVLCALIYQGLGAYSQPMREQLEPNHAYALEKYSHIIGNLKNSQFFSDVLNADFDEYAKQHDITPERIVEKVELENHLSDEDIIRYIMYRLACRLQSRFAHLNAYDTPDVPDAYFQFWRERAESIGACEDLVNHIVHALCENKIYIQSTENMGESLQGGVKAGPDSLSRLEVSIHIKRGIAQDASMLLHTIDHEITHIEQLINGFVIDNNNVYKRELYKNSPVPRSSEIDAIELEADYNAALLRPLAQYFAYDLLGATHVSERVASDVRYLSPGEFHGFLLQAQKHLSLSERHRQNMFVYTIYPRHYKASRMLNSVPGFVGSASGSALIGNGIYTKNALHMCMGCAVVNASLFASWLTGKYPRFTPQRPYNTYCVHNPHTWKARAAIMCDYMFTKLYNTVEDLVMVPVTNIDRWRKSFSLRRSKI